MSSRIENFSSRLSHQKFEGSLVDFNTGALRRNHVLVQKTPAIELFIGLGPVAGAALDFAFGKIFEPNSFFAQCDAVDQALTSGASREIEQLGATADIADIKEPHLRRLALLEMVLEKARVDDPVHPGYPKGDPQGRGGQFRLKDAPEDTTEEAQESTEGKPKESAEQKLERLRALREFRAAAQTALVLLRTLPLEEVPGVDVVVSIKAAIDLARIAIELGNDETEINKAIDFVKHGPYTLDELRVDKDDKGFSSFAAFKKTSPEEFLLKRYSGEAGDEYHHIVEQGGELKPKLRESGKQPTRPDSES